MPSSQQTSNYLAPHGVASWASEVTCVAVSHSDADLLSRGSQVTGKGLRGLVDVYFGGLVGCEHPISNGAELEAAIRKFPFTELELERWLAVVCENDRQIVRLRKPTLTLPLLGPDAAALSLPSSHLCRWSRFSSVFPLSQVPGFHIASLDFLHADDLLAASLVCKGLHPASHDLFSEETAALARRRFANGGSSSAFTPPSPKDVTSGSAASRAPRGFINRGIVASRSAPKLTGGAAAGPAALAYPPPPALRRLQAMLRSRGLVRKLSLLWGSPKRALAECRRAAAAREKGTRLREAAATASINAADANEDDDEGGADSSYFFARCPKFGRSGKVAEYVWTLLGPYKVEAAPGGANGADGGGGGGGGGGAAAGASTFARVPSEAAAQLGADVEHGFQGGAGVAAGDARLEALAALFRRAAERGDDVFVVCTGA